MSSAQGFWSYVRKDDDGMHGAIKRLADHVKAEYEVLTGGVELNLFFDSATLKWGDRWESRIRDALEATTFFIPIITPRYFASEECRSELLGFAEHAKDLGLEGLILPLYFTDVEAIENKNFSDPAVQLIADRHREDWRNLRLLDETIQPYRVAVHRLAKQLLDFRRERDSSGPLAINPAKEEDEDEGESGGVPRAPEPATEPGKSIERSPAADKGILELLSEGEEAFPRIVETLSAIAPQIELVGELATSATKEMGESDQSGKGFRGRLAVMNRLAKRLADPASKLERLTSQYAADLLVLDPAMTNLVQLAASQSKENPTEVEEFFSMVAGMVDSSGKAAEGIKGMIAAMDGNTNFSRELDEPLRRMRTSLQSMVDGHQMVETWQVKIDEAGE